MTGRLTLLGLAALIATSTLMISEPAEAKDRRPHRVDRTYGGKIIIVKKRLPMMIKSRRHLVSHLRKYKTAHVWPNKKVKGEKQWKFHFMAFFNRKLNDVEVKVKFYDVTRGSKKFIEGDAMYLDRGQTNFASYMILEKPQFQPNRQYKMYIASAKSGRTLAQVKFWLRGQRETYSGKVEFSDEEAKLK